MNIKDMNQKELIYLLGNIFREGWIFFNEGIELFINGFYNKYKLWYEEWNIMIAIWNEIILKWIILIHLGSRVAELI